MKLSENQQAIVDRLNAGEKLWWYHGIRYNGHYSFEHDHTGGKSITRTVDSLIKQGVLKMLPAQSGAFRNAIILTATNPPKISIVNIELEAHVVATLFNLIQAAVEDSDWLDRPQKLHLCIAAKQIAKATASGEYEAIVKELIAITDSF